MKKRKRKRTIGQRTPYAIINCETYEQYKRLCKIGGMVVSNYKRLADAFVDEFILFDQRQSTKVNLDKACENLGRAVDEAKWDWFWLIAYKIALRRRGV